MLQLLLLQKLNLSLAVENVVVLCCCFFDFFADDYKKFNLVAVNRNIK
jgi:hypothetical protein